MEEDGVGQDRVEGPAEVIAPHVEDPGLVPSRAKSLDEGWRRVSAIEAEAALFKVLRFPSRSAPKFQHMAPRYVRDDLVEEGGYGIGNRRRGASEVRIYAVLVRRQGPVRRAGHDPDSNDGTPPQAGPESRLAADPDLPR